MYARLWSFVYMFRIECAYRSNDGLDGCPLSATEIRLKLGRMLVHVPSDVP